MRVVHRELQSFFADPLPPITAVAEALGAHSFEIESVEGEGEWGVVTVDVLPNRGADALSHRGIAREIAAVLRRPLAHDPLASPEPRWNQREVGLHLSIAGDAPVNRYMAALIDGIVIQPSPAWLQRTLEACGVRPVNVVVDVTNYVMIRLGQPLHAFDADKLAGESEVVSLSVRHSRQDESLVLLGGERVVLPAGLAVVVDSHRDRPVALAGVKGGAAAEVGDRTQRVVLEAAHFPPQLVRRAVRALGSTTEAARRFQHNPSPRLAAYGLGEAIRLLQELVGGEVRAVAEYRREEEQPPSPVTVRLAAVEELVGVGVTADEAREILTLLGCKVIGGDGEVLRVVPPWERRDLTCEEDFVEELARLRGYDRLPARPLVPTTPPPADPLQYWTDRIRLALRDKGAVELMTYSLVAAGAVCAANPLASDKRCLRTRLAPGVRAALERGEPFLPLLGPGVPCVFEIGEVVEAAPTATPPWRERLHIVLASYGEGKRGRRRAREALAALAQVVEQVVGTALAWERDETLLTWEAPLDEVLTNREAPPYELDLSNPQARYSPPSPYPTVVRDVACWLPDGMDEEEVASLVRDAAGPLAVRVDCFDRYEREGRVSLAFRLVFQAPDHTLTDEEVNERTAAVVAALQARGCAVR